MRRFHSPHPCWSEPHPWQPLTDAEYDALLPFLADTAGDARGRGPGRPPADRRRTLDAIFWIACSRLPWRALPPDLGVRPDSAHRQLRRWSRAGVLDALLRAVAAARRRRGAATPAAATFRGLDYRICRAWRRMARLASLPSLLLVKRLGLYTAMPCAPWFLPNPDLSETLRRYTVRLLTAVIEDGHRPPRGLLSLLGRLTAFAGGNRRWFRLA